MIIETKGDLIALCEAGRIHGMVHGCNCMHAMGSGIAGQLARKYPEVPQADIDQTAFGDFTKIGTFTDALVCLDDEADNMFMVYNAYTQKTPSYNGEDVFEYEAFPRVLQAIRSDIEQNINANMATPNPNWKFVLGFPQIGAGLAGGDWPRIRQMILDEFQDHPNIIAVLVEYQP